MFSPAEVELLEAILRRELAKEIRKLQVLASTVEESDDVLDWHADSSRTGANPAAVYESKERIESLSDNASTVITILRDGNKALNNAGRVTKSSLRFYLITQCRWQNSLVDEVFAELVNSCKDM